MATEADETLPDGEAADMTVEALVHVPTMVRGRLARRLLSAKVTAALARSNAAAKREAKVAGMLWRQGAPAIEASQLPFEGDEPSCGMAVPATLRAPTILSSKSQAGPTQSRELSSCALVMAATRGVPSQHVGNQ